MCLSTKITCIQVITRLLPFVLPHRTSTLRSVTMKAVRASRFGGPEVLGIDTGVPVPTPSATQVS